MIDYYKQIDDALKSYENHKPYHRFTMGWICDRIVWAWQFRHITREQMEELADRATAILDNN